MTTVDHEAALEYAKHLSARGGPMGQGIHSDTNLARAYLEYRNKANGAVDALMEIRKAQDEKIESQHAELVLLRELAKRADAFMSPCECCDEDASSMCDCRWKLGRFRDSLEAWRSQTGGGK